MYINSRAANRHRPGHVRHRAPHLTAGGNDLCRGVSDAWITMPRRRKSRSRPCSAIQALGRRADVRVALSESALQQRLRAVVHHQRSSHLCSSHEPADGPEVSPDIVSDSFSWPVTPGLPVRTLAPGQGLRLDRVGSFNLRRCRPGHSARPTGRSPANTRVAQYVRRQRPTGRIPSLEALQLPPDRATSLRLTGLISSARPRRHPRRLRTAKSSPHCC